MAQWKVRRTSNPEAVGSSPTGDVTAFKDSWPPKTQLKTNNAFKCAYSSCTYIKNYEESVHLGWGIDPTTFGLLISTCSAGWPDFCIFQ